MKSISSIVILLLAIAMLTGGALAQSYPHKPIRLLVPYAPGGGTDILARVIGQKLSENLGQPVVVENRPGASCQIATEMVAKGTPDGHLLVLATIAHSINPALYSKLPYDSVKDFAPVTLLASVPLALVVTPSLPAKSVKELIELAKAKPGELIYGMATGSLPHLAGEMFKSMVGVKIVAVPYKGNAPVYPDLISGRVQFMFDALSSALPQVEAGKVRALGVTSAKRSQAAPDMPTLAESGVPGFAADAWYGILAPASTPKEVIIKLHSETVKALNTPSVKERLHSLGYDIIGDSPENFSAYIKAEIVKWGKVVKDSGAKIE